MTKRTWSRKDKYYEKQCSIPLPVAALVLAVVVAGTATALILLLRFPPLPFGELDRLECPGKYDAASCRSKGCQWSGAKSAPCCYMGKESFGYVVNSTITQKSNGFSLLLRNKTDFSVFGPSIPKVRFEVTYLTENILRFKLVDDSNKRYEVPVQKEFPLLLKNLPTPKSLNYEVDVTEKEGAHFAFNIKRKDNGTVLWNTSIGGPILSDQFLQMATYLPSKNVYGLGENNHESFRHQFDYKSWPLFARDQFPLDGRRNLYGVHPFYTCLETDGKSHGVLFLNSNAMEVTLMPQPALSFRTIGGVLDFFIFVGNDPEHVVQLYTSLIGRPMMPPFWSLGFQLSRYGYNNISYVKEAVERTRKALIPQDVQYLDIDHMLKNKDFTWDEERFKGLDTYIKQTKTDHGLRWIIILDPAIDAEASKYEIYDDGAKKGVFVRRSADMQWNLFPDAVANTSDALFGKVWPHGVVAFPDYFLEKTKTWWKQAIVDYHKKIQFDGLWIDMNEPSNFGTNEDNPFYCTDDLPCWSLKCPKSDLDDPPYNPLASTGSERLSRQTLCMSGVQGNKGELRHYDVHSIYGWSQTESTLRAAQEATGQRSVVISRSTFVSSGRHCGHWLGDNHSRWKDLHRSVIGMMEFNLFGIPYIGADVCGFFGDTTDDMCKRWMQLGAFYPFFRNHNGEGQKVQDPGALSEGVVQSCRSAVLRRYSLLPYLYTLFYRSHRDGNTVIRPLFHEFPTDENTWDIDTQFLWGSSLLISPILNEGQKSVRMYLPNDVWYKFNYEKSEEVRVVGSFMDASGVDDDIPLHVRGGTILPTQEPALSTSKSKENKFTLYIFPKYGGATGELFWDDGVSKDTVEKENYILIRFRYLHCKLTFELESGATSKVQIPELKEVIVFKTKLVQSVLIDGKKQDKFSLQRNQALNITVNSRMGLLKEIHWEDDQKKCQMYD